jgi:hypothetical protein
MCREKEREKEREKKRERGDSNRRELLVLL